MRIKLWIKVSNLIYDENEQYTLNSTIFIQIIDIIYILINKTNNNFTIDYDLIPVSKILL